MLKIQNIHHNTTMLHIAGIKNCDKIRDTKKWMEEHNVEYEFIDVREEPLTRDELKELEFKVGLDVLLNKRGRKWRDLGLADKDLSEEELFEQLLEHQVMIKRPVLIKDESVLVGYDEESFEAYIADEEPEEK
ncbi:arsenate reductase family protein [Gracilimonas sp.]|uniref:arsenate reductase family protein n=1 Tax=Gracilimonas sp. TaxID=1974203 RepID=UPI003BA98A75